MNKIDEVVARYLDEMSKDIKLVNEVSMADFKKAAKQFGVDLKGDFVELTKHAVDKWKANKRVKELLAQGFKVTGAARGKKDEIVVMTNKHNEREWVKFPV